MESTQDDYPSPEPLKFEPIQVNQIKNERSFLSAIMLLYEDFIGRSRYTTLADFADFWAFVMQQETGGKSRHLKEVWSEYPLDMDEIARKYKGTGEFGGNCFGLSRQLIQRIKSEFPAEGFLREGDELQMHILPSLSDNAVSQLSIAGRSVPWDEAKAAMEYSHGSVVVAFAEEGRESQYLVLEAGQGHSQANVFPTEAFFNTIMKSRGYEGVERGIVPESVVHLNQRLIRARTEFSLYRGQNDPKDHERLSGNLMDGVLRYVVSDPTKLDWFTTVGDGILKGDRKDKLFQLKLEVDHMLEHREDACVITWQGQPREINNEALLRLFLSFVEARFAQPKGTGKVLMHMFESRERIMRELYYPGAHEAFEAKKK